MAERITDDFKQMVADYLKVSDELSDNNKKIKNIKDRKKQLEDSIKDYMVDNELFNLDLNQAGSLSITTKKIIKKVGKQDVHDILLETIQEDTIRDTIIAKVFPENEDNEVTKLQRKKGRSSA